MTWLRAIQGVISRDKRVRLFYVIDKDLRPSRVFAATFSCAGTYRVFWNLRATRIVLPWRQFAESFVFFANLSVFVIWRGSPPRMSELLTYLHLEDGAESVRWVKLCLISPKACQQNLASKYYPDPRQASGDLLLKLQYVGFFFFFPPFWKDWIPSFANITFIVFVFFPIFSSAAWFAGTCSLASPEGKSSGNGWSKQVHSGLSFFSPLPLWHREGRIAPTKDSKSVRV